MVQRALLAGCAESLVGAIFCLSPLHEKDQGGSFRASGLCICLCIPVFLSLSFSLSLIDTNFLSMNGFVFIFYIQLFESHTAVFVSVHVCRRESLV